MSPGVHCMLITSVLHGPLCSGLSWPQPTFGLYRPSVVWMSYCRFQCSCWPGVHVACHQAYIMYCSLQCCMQINIQRERERGFLVHWVKCHSACHYCWPHCCVSCPIRVTLCTRSSRTCAEQLLFVDHMFCNCMRSFARFQNTCEACIRTHK